MTDMNLDNFKDKLEDLLFSVLQRLPEKLIPQPAMDWMFTYIEKRTQEIQRQIVRQNWKKAELEQILTELQQDKVKAPTQD